MTLTITPRCEGSTCGLVFVDVHLPLIHYKNIKKNDGSCKHPFPVQLDWWVRIEFEDASRIHLSNIFYLDI